jgi:hypothetical protein
MSAPEDSTTAIVLMKGGANFIWSEARITPHAEGLAVISTTTHMTIAALPMSEVYLAYTRGPDNYHLNAGGRFVRKPDGGGDAAT